MVASHLLRRKKFFVYMFTFPNKKSYVGRTCDFSKRIRNHFKKSSGCIYVRNCLLKYGLENTDITILKTDLKGAYLANQWEKFFIRAFDTLAPRGLNLTPGGDGVCYTDEIRRKISEGLRGRKLSKDHRKKLSIAGKGRIKSAYTCRKLSEALTGRVRTEEHCQNISKSRLALNIRLTDAQKEHLRNINLGKKMPPEAVRKAVETRIANGNHRHSEKTKKQISELKKGKPLSEEHKQSLRDGHKNSTFDWSTTRKYKDEDIIQVFNELDGNRNKTAEKLGIHYNTVFRCLKRNNLTRC